MRILEIINDGPLSEELEHWIEQYDCSTKIRQSGKHGMVVIRMVVQDDQVVHILNDLDKYRGQAKAFVYNVEGSLGIIDEAEDEDDLGLAKFFTSSKEELRKQIITPVNLSWNFLIMVIASSFVAGIGLLQNNVAIVIGAMVIAPFLGPNMLISFGTVLGDLQLVRKGLLVAAVGTMLALLISLIWGMASDQVDAMNKGYVVTYQDVVLAMACGVAGALSQLSRQGTTLVGVMVAAALLPPLIAAGLYFGGGYYTDAWNKLILFAANIISLVTSSIIVFYLAGISPNNWWEREIARERTRNSLLLLLVLLILLIATIYKLNLS